MSANSDGKLALERKVKIAFHTNIITDGSLLISMTSVFVYSDLHNKQHCCNTMILPDTNLIRNRTL